MCEIASTTYTLSQTLPSVSSTWHGRYCWRSLTGRLDAPQLGQRFGVMMGMREVCPNCVMSMHRSLATPSKSLSYSHRARRADRRLRSAAACEHGRSRAARKCVAAKAWNPHSHSSRSLNGSTASMGSAPLARSRLGSVGKTWPRIREGRAEGQRRGSDNGCAGVSERRNANGNAR